MRCWAIISSRDRRAGDERTEGGGRLTDLGQPQAGQQGGEGCMRAW